MPRPRRIAADPAPADSPARVRSQLLASRVAGSRYIFPNLAPRAGERWTVALAGREECAADYLVERERYPFHSVEVVAAGRGSVRLGGGKGHAIGPGSVFCYAPDMPCRIESDAADPLVKFFFALAGRDVARVLREAGLAPGAVRRVSAPAEIVGIAENAILEGARHTARTAEICAKWVELLLLKVRDAGDARRTGRERARENFLRCRSLIETNAAHLSSLEEAARLAGIDAASMCRLFRRFQGTSPYRYLMRRKMALAAEFLMESDGMVKEAAAQVGFADPYHFTRCFKSVHGIAPSAVRRYRPRG
ncbi:MAG: helix-turn-helix transcriptional regulator [Opitutae bacterium]|nr:helix-turn-helix transcriptional regulator [Opitutae bacterium]